MKTFRAIITEVPQDAWRSCLATKRTIQAPDIHEAHRLAHREAMRFIASISPTPKGAIVETTESD